MELSRLTAELSRLAAELSWLAKGVDQLSMTWQEKFEFDITWKIWVRRYMEKLEFDVTYKNLSLTLHGKIWVQRYMEKWRGKMAQLRCLATKSYSCTDVNNIKLNSNICITSRWK